MDLYLQGKNNPGALMANINSKKWNGFFFTPYSRQGGILQYNVRELLTSLLMKKINDSCTEKWFVFSRLPVSKLAAYSYISGPLHDSKR